MFYVQVHVQSIQSMWLRQIYILLITSSTYGCNDTIPACTVSFTRAVPMQIYNYEACRNSTSTCTACRDEIFKHKYMLRLWLRLNYILLITTDTNASNDTSQTFTGCLKMAIPMQIYNDGACTRRTSTCTAYKNPILTYKYMYVRQEALRPRCITFY